MDFVLRPTLKHMSLLKIATQLCTHEDFSSPNDELLGNAKEKVRALPLPAALKTELEYLIQPIISQMLEWSQYLFNYYDIDERKVKRLHWSSSGTFDAEKSVEDLVADQSLAPKSRNNLAEDYNFVQRIRALRTDIPPDFRQFPDLHPRTFVNSETDRAYREIISRELSAPSLAQREFCRALLSGRPGAAKCSYENLEFEEKSEWVFSLVRRELRLLTGFFERTRCPKEFFAEILCFLLSRMSEIQRMEILEKNPEDSLLSLVVWPYQSLFIPTLNKIWGFLGQQHFDRMLTAIFAKINHDGEVCFFRNIFRDFWSSSPDPFKKDWLNLEHLTWLQLNYFFNNGEDDICRMMLKEADVKETDRLLDQAPKNVFWGYKKTREIWKFLMFFIAECGSSREAVSALRQRVLKMYANSTPDEETRKLFLFLENFIGKSQ